MPVFEFRANDPEHGLTIARIDADDVRKARAVLKGMIFERRLSTQEVIRATQHGYAIIDAETGQTIRTEPENALGNMASAAGGPGTAGATSVFDTPGRDDGGPL